MRAFLLITVICMTTHLFGQKPIEIRLWPQGETNSSEQPQLFVYKAEKPNGTAIIMCPGGSYSGLAINHEGHDMASWFNTLGITYMVLKYRMPHGNYEVPLSDAEQAMRIVRAKAREWGINPDKVGIMGASAGGHLASTLATHYTGKETKPAFQILFYPVITMDKSYTHEGSRKNLLGENPTAELERRFSNEKQVTPHTPKAFIILSSDDKGVPAANGVNYYLALVKNDVSASLHAYPVGGHGWGFRDNFPYKHQWTLELEKWLNAEVL